MPEQPPEQRPQQHSTLAPQPQSAPQQQTPQQIRLQPPIRPESAKSDVSSLSIEERLDGCNVDADFIGWYRSMLGLSDGTPAPTADLQEDDLKARVVTLQGELDSLRRQRQQDVDALQGELQRVRSMVHQAQADKAAAEENLELTNFRNIELQELLQEAHRASRLQGEELVQAKAAVDRLSGACSESSLAALSIKELQRLQSLHIDGLSATQRAMTRRLEQDCRDQQDRQTCIVCLDRAIDCVTIPCGHQIMCEECSSKVVTCPIDRQPITARIRTFGR